MPRSRSADAVTKTSPRTINAVARHFLLPGPRGSSFRDRGPNSLIPAQSRKMPMTHAPKAVTDMKVLLWEIGETLILLWYKFYCLQLFTWKNQREVSEHFNVRTQKDLERIHTVWRSRVIECYLRNGKISVPFVFPNLWWWIEGVLLLFPLLFLDLKQKCEEKVLKDYFGVCTPSPLQKKVQATLYEW